MFSRQFNDCLAIGLKRSPGSPINLERSIQAPQPKHRSKVMRALSPCAALWSAAIMCTAVLASTPVFAQPQLGSAQTAKSVIELAPSSIPDVYRLMPQAGEASFANAPAN